MHFYDVSLIFNISISISGLISEFRYCIDKQKLLFLLTKKLLFLNCSRAIKLVWRHVFKRLCFTLIHFYDVSLIINKNIDLLKHIYGVSLIHDISIINGLVNVFRYCISEVKLLLLNFWREIKLVWRWVFKK